jgi:hypothetical protein
VTGIRQDAFAKRHPIVVEEEKAVANRGHYLNPEAFGKPASLGIGVDKAELASAHLAKRDHGVVQFFFAAHEGAPPLDD